VAKAWHGRGKSKVPDEKPLNIRLLGPPEVSFEGSKGRRV